MERILTKHAEGEPFRILSLDGGGSKGVYTLGVLLEVEKMLGKPLFEHFHLIYGTSTGSIIAALLALGESVETIKKHYWEIIPTVMKKKTKGGRSRMLRLKADEVFGERDFSHFKTHVGIVSTNCEHSRPMIFKSSVSQAHGMKSSFQPGFGCSIKEAILASCAALPFFQRVVVNTNNQGSNQLLDGGFTANNPALFALIDAINAFGIDQKNIRLLSVGVGSYPDPGLWIIQKIRSAWPLSLLDLTLSTNSNTHELVRKLLLPDIPAVRISDSFESRNLSTSLLESSARKLNRIQNLGRGSFGKYETEIRNLL